MTAGIPLPRGLSVSTDRWALRTPEGHPVPLQVRVLDRWSDGSIRWALLDFQATVRGAGLQTREYAAGPQAPEDAERSAGLQPRESFVTLSFDSASPASEERIRVTPFGDGVTVDTGAASFSLSPQAPALFSEVIVKGAPVIEPIASMLAITTSEGRPAPVTWRRLVVEEEGPLRTVVYAEGETRCERKAKLHLFARLHFFAGSPVVRLLLTIRNPRRAAHPGGYWELGDAGSMLLKDVSLILRPPSSAVTTRICCSVEPGAAPEVATASLEVYQDSSGGENWKSSNHVNRHGVVPNSFRGYRFVVDGRERRGLRATPIVWLEGGGVSLGATMPHFWQNFPRAIAAASGSSDAVPGYVAREPVGRAFRPASAGLKPRPTPVVKPALVTPESVGRAFRPALAASPPQPAAVLRLGFFPGEYGDLHELQGGEQKTHECFLLFGTDPVTDIPLESCRSRLLVSASPEWYAAAEAVPYLTPAAEDPHPEYLALVNAAIEGSDTFEQKRERVDQYGWRHFGDVYADHEAVRKTDGPPLVSHYNNQYDAMAGFAIQFMRSGDPRWWTLLNDLASHVVDIDIYHTSEDKAAYNHGLFWHTVHYIDAGKATHRSYPVAPGSHGGGPASEQNYTTGLMLHHFLTGDPATREAAIDLAQFVIDMDDGAKTVFRWLDRGHTGLATASGSVLYHGPGRGSANSLNALIDGHRLAGDRRFLEKAEQIIRRCVHPSQSVDALDLLDAERKWFYTMFLQALGRYLDHKIERGELDWMYAYGREALLHFARWMAEHEYPYLDKPEILEFPTETWAAQDMRKREVFAYAARHAEGAERLRFLERADFFFDYSVGTLTRAPTRTLARPVVVLLSAGFGHAWLKTRGLEPAPKPAVEAADFGVVPAFVPQKVRAIRRVKLLAAAGGSGIGLAALASLAYTWFR